MLAKRPAVLVCCLLALLLGGCASDSRATELRDLDVVVALGVDLPTDEAAAAANEVALTMQVLRADKALSESEAESSRFFSGSGSDLSAAAAAIGRRGAKTVTCDHNKLMVIGSAVLDRPALIRELLLDSDLALRPSTYVVVSTCAAAELLQAADSAGISAAYNTLNVLAALPHVVTVRELIAAFADPGQVVELPLVAVTSDGGVTIEEQLRVGFVGFGE